MSFSGPSLAQQKSSVVVILLHCIEEEMHFSVRCGALQASNHPFMLKGCFVFSFIFNMCLDIGLVIHEKVSC